MIASRILTFAVVLLAIAACATKGGEQSVAASSSTSAANVATSVPAARWHALLVAGDDNIPAFDNGIDTLRAKLSARGVRDIGMLLADPNKAAGEGLATSINVRGGLRTMGGGDACFAFLTSHGNERGFFLQADRSLMRPSQLEHALDESCGSVPTVVVVSACHSGVFLTDRLRRPNRIVLTAAARDRTSFGCGASNVYTYYDQCFLEQFDRATTWRQLADATRGCVEKLESSMGVKSKSLPQEYFGDGVAELRLPGR